jgi:hypothetical protein
MHPALPINDSPWLWTIVLGLAFIIVFGVGCAGTRQSTRLTLDDQEYVRSEIESQLRQSELLAERTPDSPRMVISVRRFLNLSSDLLTDAETWRLLERIWPESIRREKNIALTMSGNEARVLAVSPDAEPGALADRTPTHTMNATLRSTRRTSGNNRTDWYTFEYVVSELATGARQWTGSIDFKRAASGKVWN